jgi:uncharacterized membrane protein YjjP (DUF1212 family)
MRKVIVPVAAIAGIVVMECTAICHGINGKLFALSIAGVAGIGGFYFKGILDFVRKGLQ